MANLTAEQYDTLQEILKVIAETRQTFESLSESRAKRMANSIEPHKTHISSPITPMTPPQSPQPPDPPDYKPNLTSKSIANKKFPLKYSGEEIYERMETGLCLFCDEQDIPGHYQLKHKRSQISMIECEDDKEEAHQIQETVMIPEKTAGSVSDVMLVHKVDSHVKEVENLPQKSTSGNGENVVHQLFDQMPLRKASKEKQRKSLKAWKFKFKPTSKRSKSMDVKFFSVEEIAWFTKDSKEINWGCVNKEFKEVVAGCGKKIIDRFKLVDETSKPAVCDGTFQIRVWDCGGSLLECVDEPYCDGKSSEEAVTVLEECPQLLNTFFREWFKIQVFSDFDVASWIGLEIYGCETKKHMLLCVDLANRVWERGELLATHLYWELFGLKALIGLEIYKWKCKQLPIASNFRINHPHKLADLVLKRALTEQDTSLPRADWRTKNSVPFVMQCMAVQEMVLMQANETIIKTDSGQAHEFQGTIVPNLAPDFVMQLYQIRSSIFQEVHEALRLALPISTANQKKDLHRKNYMIQWSWHCVKHESQQTDFHVWHRWKNKAANLHAVYAISELMMLRLVSFQPNKGDDVVGLVPKATVLREVSHCQSNDYGTIRHKLLLVRDTSSNGYKEDSWSFIWFILKELCSAGYEWENETIKKSFKELSKHEKDHKPKNQKLLNPGAKFCTQYNDLEQLNTEHQSSPCLDYFTYLDFIWKHVLNCGCEAGYVSSRIFSVGGVRGFELQRKRLLVLNEIHLLENHNKVDLTIEENWFYNTPMIREVFHLQRPPELINIQGNPNFITTVLVQWKEHPPDQFFSGFYGKVLMLSSLRTRMF